MKMVVKNKRISSVGGWVKKGKTIQYDSRDFFFEILRGCNKQNRGGLRIGVQKIQTNP